jgi:hypothetical protein
MNVMGVVVRLKVSSFRGCLRASSGGAHESGAGGSKAGSTANEAEARPNGGTKAVTSPEPTSPEAPNTVSLLDGEADANDNAANSDTSLGPCFPAFSAVPNGMRVGLIAFVQEPGDYTGDPIHILVAHATASDGRSYVANAGGASYDGAIQLHVSSVVPRFAGTAELLLIDEAQPEMAPLALSLAFDVSWPRACGS